MVIRTKSLLLFIVPHENHSIYYGQKFIWVIHMACSQVASSQLWYVNKLCIACICYISSEDMPSHNVKSITQFPSWLAFTQSAEYVKCMISSTYLENVGAHFHTSPRRFGTTHSHRVKIVDFAGIFHSTGSVFLDSPLVNYYCFSVIKGWSFLPFPKANHCGSNRSLVMLIW